MCKFTGAVIDFYKFILVCCTLTGPMTSYCDNKKMEAFEIIHRELGVDGPFTTERLSGGLSGSEIIKINVLNKAYVVRFWNMQWADYFPQDLACQLVASDAGYGPKVHFSDEVKGITIMDYHLPEPIPEIQTRLQALVDLIKKVHAGPAVPKGIDRLVYIDQLIDETKSTQFFDPETIKEIKNTVFAATRPHVTYVACHRDLHHGNLIYTKGSFFAIDYTWGAMDDPYVDLANIAIYNCETPEEEELLLQLYFGHAPTPKEIAKLSLMKLPVKLFYGLEFLGAGSAGTKSNEVALEEGSKNYKDFGCYPGKVFSHADYLSYARVLLDEVVDYSRSEQYTKDLHLLQK